jgi:hypothetical protein
MKIVNRLAPLFARSGKRPRPRLTRDLRPVVAYCALVVSAIALGVRQIAADDGGLLCGQEGLAYCSQASEPVRMASVTYADLHGDVERGTAQDVLPDTEPGPVLTTLGDPRMSSLGPVGPPVSPEGETSGDAPTPSDWLSNQTVAHLFRYGLRIRREQ